MSARARIAGNDEISDLGIAFDAMADQLSSSLNLIRKEKERTQRYLNVARTMIIVLDTKGRVVVANREACKILEYHENEIIGKNWFDHFLPVPFRKDVKKVFEALISDPPSSYEIYENPILAKSGTTRTIEWHNANIIDDHGTISAIISSGIDITEKKEAQRYFELTAKVFENTADAIVVTEKRWHPLYCMDVDCRHQRRSGEGEQLHQCFQ